jgi:putative hydrolase
MIGLVSTNPEGWNPDAFADAPLFRELQRVLLSSSGPVNWELARQIAVATSSGSGDPSPPAAAKGSFEEAVRVAELAVSELTGMSAPEEVTRVRAVRRAEWVEANIRGLQGFFEPAAEHLGRALAQARREESSEAEVPMMLDALLDRMAPLLMGAQVGVVLGSLAQRVLGQYELPLPRTGEASLLFVVPNIEAFERDWSLPPVEFREWVAFHEVTHAFQLARPWVGEHFLGLVREVAEGMEFDVRALSERLEGLDLSDPERLTEALGDTDLLEGALTEEQRLLLARIQAFMGAAEGHAAHVMEVAGRRILPTFDRIDEAMRRQHEERSQEQRAVDRLMGIEVKIDQYRLGREFCERVVELTDEETLSRMWDGPEALPSMPELEEPRLWLARMA